MPLVRNSLFANENRHFKMLMIIKEFTYADI